MREIVRTNDAVLITAIEALFDGAHIPYLVLDQNMSVLEGSLGILPRRILVDDEHQERGAPVADRCRPRPRVAADARRGAADELTDDAMLGGQLRLTQKRRGHRFGHDAILLAAAADAKPGDRVVDLGAGVGAAGLALAARVPDLEVTLVEIDPELVAIATENIARNGLADRARAVALDVAASAEAFAAAGLSPGTIDHVLMNPPFNDPARQNVSPDAERRTAHAAPASALATWIEAARRCCIPPAG